MWNRNYDLDGYIAGASFILLFAIGQLGLCQTTSTQASVGTSPIQTPKPQTQDLPHSRAYIVQGTVTDFIAGKSVTNAAVVLASQEHEHKRSETVSNKNGFFSFSNIESGQWLLTVTAEGMLAYSEKITVPSAVSTNLRIALDEIESADILRITGKRTLIHPEKIGSTTHLDHRFLEQYKSGNNLREVINSTPGIVPDSFGNIITRGEHNAINYEIDGVVLPETANTLNQGQFASPRALNSVDVEIGGYQARDGGGPLGAVVRMRSLPISNKPILEFGGQLGGPLAGNLYYRASSPLSQDPHSILSRIKIESVGQSYATTLGLEPPVKHFRHNNRLDLNFLNKIEFQATEKDKFKLTVGINETFLQIPTSGTSQHFGVRMNEHDRQNFIILSYNRKGEKFFDEANLHIVNAFYSQLLKSRNTFDPFPILNGEEALLQSVSPRGKRFNYALSFQGDIKKRVFNTHNLLAGFLTELRPVKTHYSGLYYNADPRSPLFPATPAEVPVLYGAPISPFTGMPGGPLFVGNIGRYRGFRYLQSAYFQDTWKPITGFLKRLTVDAGIRADVYHGVFGNTLNVAQAISTIAGVGPFLLKPFQRQTVTDAQVSGRFGASFVLTPNTVIRGSFANIFQPPPVDLFVLPPIVSEGPVNGIFNGTARPLRATRGHLVDVSIERQVGPRFVARTNLYYKKLKNFGDSGVIVNTPLYNRLTLSNQEAYGIETRLDLKPNREGFGFSGFVSSTVGIAYLRGSKSVTGGIYEQEGPVFTKYPDHDRRFALQAGLGYRSRNRIWCLAEISVLSGLPDRRDVAVFGPHPARTPPLTLLGFNAGYELPAKVRKSRLMPTGIEVRMQNLLNQRLPINLGSPFQGTRYTLPIRILAGAYWKV